MSENIVGPNSSYGGQSVVTYVGSSPAVDDVVVFADTSGLRIKDSAVKLSTKLSVDGSLAMTGDLDLGDKDIKNTANIHPRDNNDADIGTASKRFKTIYYTTLDPVPGAVVGGYLALDGSTTMAGDIKMGTNDITGVGQVAGATVTRDADAIVAYNSATATPGSIAAFSGTSGRIVFDSLVQAVDCLTSVAGGVTGSVPVFSGTKTIGDSGIVGTNVVTHNSTATSGRVATFSGNKTIQDGGTLLSDLVTSSSAGTTGNLPVFSGAKAVGGSAVVAADVVTHNSTATSGRVATFSGNKTIQDGGTLLSSLLTSSSAASTYLALAGGNMTGDIDMKSNDIQGVRELNGEATTREVDSMVSYSGTTTTGHIPIFTGATAAKYISDSAMHYLDIVANPTGTVVSGEVPQFSGATGRVIISSGHAIAEYAPLAGAIFTGGVKVRTSEPVSCTKLVQTAFGTTLTGTATETSWFNGASTAGSFVFPTSTAGLTVRFTGYAGISMAAAETLTVRLKNTSGTQITHTITPGAISTLRMKVDIVCTFQSGTASITFCHITLPGAVVNSYGAAATGTWNGGTSQTLDVTLQFSSSSGTNNMQTNIATIETLYET
jgi:hypothetical protein